MHNHFENSHSLFLFHMHIIFHSLTLPLGRVTVNGLEKCLSVCPTPLYRKNWTLLDFHTWHVYTPPKWQERALTNIFSTILEAIKKGPLGVASFSLPDSSCI